MPILVNIEKSPLSLKKNQFVARIMNGYRQGNLLQLSNENSFPQHFVSFQQAAKWLENTGYTIINSNP